MNRTALALIIATSLSLPAASADANIITFSGALTGTQEVPPNASPGTGLATVTIDDVTHSLLFDVSWSGLLSPTTIAHIHCCAPPGATAIPATGVPTFPGFPTGTTSGTFNATFDLDDPGLINPMFVTANGGTTAAAFDAFLTGLLAGNAYINIHTQQFGAGEIRGQLAPVPEPATWAMLLFGFAAVGLAFRRSRRRTAVPA